MKDLLKIAAVGGVAFVYAVQLWFLNMIIQWAMDGHYVRWLLVLVLLAQATWFTFAVSRSAYRFLRGW